MKHYQTRNKSWSTNPISISSLFSAQPPSPVQQTPVKYYIAEQVLKDAFRRQEYILQQLSHCQEQNLLLERIRETLTVSNSKSKEHSEESFCQSDNLELSQKQTIRMTKKRSYNIEANSSAKTESGRRNLKDGSAQETILERIRTQLRKEDWEFVFKVFDENKQLRQRILNSQRYQQLLEDERKDNQVLRLQISKNQNKIKQMDKQSAMLHKNIKILKQEKLNHSQGIHKIQKQLKVYTTNSTNLIIQQKVLRNQRKKLDLERQIVGKLTKELDDQMYDIQRECVKYLPQDIVKEGREEIRRYTQLLKGEYEKTKQLNEEIRSFNSKIWMV